MTDRDAQPYAAFRLNLEQQHKRAKDLLKAAKAGEPEALRRLHGAASRLRATPKLAQAQHCIARELRFASWAALKRHIGDMERARRALERQGPRRRLPHDAHSLWARHRARAARTPGCTATSTRTSIPTCRAR